MLSNSRVAHCFGEEAQRAAHSLERFAYAKLIRAFIGFPVIDYRAVDNLKVRKLFPLKGIL